jgi:hypothetical protein
VVGASEPAGSNCATGGVAYISVSGTDYVCNGAVGATGAQGATGSTGAQGPAGPGLAFSGALNATVNAGTYYAMLNSVSFANSENLIYQVVRLIPVACNLSLKVFVDLYPASTATYTLRTSPTTILTPTFTGTAATCDLNSSTNFCSSPSVAVVANTLVTLQVVTTVNGIHRGAYVISCI